jgi:hypothetical protein
MFDVVVAVNDDEILSANLLRSPLLNQANVTLHVQKGYRSASSAYQAAYQNCRNDLIIFVHQDVYIPAGWDQKLSQHIAVLDKTAPNWAVLGLYGATPSGEHVGYVWSSGLNQIVGGAFDKPILAGSVDELLIVLKRSSDICFDERLPGFHLYGTDIVQSALAQGKSAFIVCTPVIHNSRPILYLDSKYFAAYNYIANKWQQALPIANCVCPITDSMLFSLKNRLKQTIRKIRYRHVDRATLDRHFDSVELAKHLGFE